MYQSSAAKAARRALSLLSVSLDKGEVSEYGCDLSEEGIRNLPMTFLEQLVEYIADQYGSLNWLDGIPMDIQFQAFTHRYETDRYGNDHMIQLQYNAKGHCCLLALPQDAWLTLCHPDYDGSVFLPDAISIYMD